MSVTARVPYNVVLIAADTVRPDHLSCYGYACQTSPSIDRLASEGLRFTDYHAAQIPTHPAFTTLLTGVDPLYHGILSHSGTRQLASDIPMLAQRLHEAGYESAAVDNMMAMESAPTWFARGFDFFRVYRYAPGTGEAERLTTSAIELAKLAATTGRPFFFFIHYFDPHTPYAPPEDYRRRFYEGNESDPANASLRDVLAPDDPLTPLLLGNLVPPAITDRAYVLAQYDAEIAFMDAQIGRLLEAVDALFSPERTLTIFLSDHGEAFGEGGLHFDHHTLHDAVTRCALIMRLRGVIPSGGTRQELVSSLDVAPTMLDYLGLPGIEPHAMAGRSLRPLIERGEAIRADVPLGEATRQVSRGIVTPAWRLIEPVTTLEDGRAVPDFLGRPRSAEPLLFCRLEDSWEQQNVAGRYPDLVADLRSRIAARLAAAAQLTGVPDPFVRCWPTLEYHRMLTKFRARLQQSAIP